MGIGQRSQGGFSGQSAHTPQYRTIFRKHVFTLLKMGYDLLDKPALVQEQEPAITGDLAEAMNTVKHQPGQPQWMYNLAVHDDPPLNTTSRRGKYRPRADLIIELTGTSACWEFTFEAKRFYPHSGVPEYIGQNGLGMFLREIYAPNAGDVGMLGYVQNKSIAFWEAKLFEAMTRNNPQAEAVVHGLSTFRTRHKRENNSAFWVYHALLLFR